MECGSADATLLDRFTRILRRLMDGGHSLLVALSGGADSSALLWLAARSAPQLGVQVRACHVHHGLRGNEADGDAEACRRLCWKAQVPLIIQRVHIDPDQTRRDGVESAARAARYAALTAAAHTGELIALAHTLDDQAETVLLNMIRGSGSHGLGGMTERHGILIRPLLSERRQTLRQYCRTERIDWRDDSTNADVSYARNRVRLRILPELEAINPGFVAAAGRLSAIHRAESQWWSGYTDALIEQAGAVWNGVAAVRCDLLPSMCEALSGRLLLRMIDRALGSHMHVEREHILLASDAVNCGRSFTLELPRGTGVLRVRHGWLSVEAPPAAPCAVISSSGDTTLRFNDVSLDVPPGLSAVIRYPEPGDRTFHAGKRVTVGECLRQRCVPPPWRSRVPVVATRDQMCVLVPDWAQAEIGIHLKPAPPMTPHGK